MSCIIGTQSYEIACLSSDTASRLLNSVGTIKYYTDFQTGTVSMNLYKEQKAMT